MRRDSDTGTKLAAVFIVNALTIVGLHYWAEKSWADSWFMAIVVSVLARIAERVDHAAR